MQEQLDLDLFPGKLPEEFIIWNIGIHGFLTVIDVK